MSEKQSRYSVKSPSRGGKRPNSGRPKGSTNKISPSTLIHDFHKTMGMSFSQFVNKKIKEAHDSGDDALVAKYILGLGDYFVNNTQQIDMTTGGESLNAKFNFPKEEIKEWKYPDGPPKDWSDVPVTIKVK